MWHRLAPGTRTWSPHLPFSPCSQDAPLTSGRGDPSVASRGSDAAAAWRAGFGGGPRGHHHCVGLQPPSLWPSPRFTAAKCSSAPNPALQAWTQAHCAPGCPHAALTRHRPSTATEAPGYECQKTGSSQLHPGLAGPSGGGACTSHPGASRGPGPRARTEGCTGAFPFGERSLGWALGAFWTQLWSVRTRLRCRVKNRRGPRGHGTDLSAGPPVRTQGHLQVRRRPQRHERWGGAGARRTFEGLAGSPSSQDKGGRERGERQGHAAHAVTGRRPQPTPLTTAPSGRRAGPGQHGATGSNRVSLQAGGQALRNLEPPGWLRPRTLSRTPVLLRARPWTLRGHPA